MRPTRRRARATPQRRAGSGGAEDGGLLASWDRIVRTIGGGPVDFIARGRGVVTQHAVIGADRILRTDEVGARQRLFAIVGRAARGPRKGGRDDAIARSEEHTSELQSLMRISNAVICLKKKKT